ncbi:MAG: D-alanyl-D-alanine carboxypeptidase family protein [Micavibrio sp.]|nr:D-alanyl-D-alanine carboxypeptidase family protein [Micavibrio sp.]
MSRFSLALPVLLLSLTFAPLAHAADPAKPAPAQTTKAQTAPAQTAKAADSAPDAKTSATLTQKSPETSDPTTAKQAFIIDYETNTVLMDKNGHERMPTSSMSKTMTIYMAFDALKKGKITLDSKFPVSEKAWRMQGSKMFVELGSLIDVQNLIRGIIIQSGNDATIVMAEGIAGTEADFVDQMNAKAKQLGMNESHFINASGWPDPDHYSTAHDLVILADHLIADFPEDYKFFSEKEFTWHNIHQMNRNPLLFRDVGADGLKTGHAEEAGAGYGLMGSGTRDGRRVVMVLNGMASEKDRANEGARLMDWALRNFENVNLFKSGDTVEKATVAMGQAAEVPMVVDRNILVTVAKAVKNDLKVTVTYKGPLMAPIKKGDEIGQLKIQLPRGGEILAPLTAGEDVPKLGLMASTVQKFKFMLNHKLDSVVR